MNNTNFKRFLFLIFVIFQNLFGQYLDFGKNKVRYEDFEWYIIRTEHFDIYYYPEITEIAEIGAKIAEDSYEALKIKFNHQINTKIPLIFYNTHLHFQQTNTITGFIPEGVGGFFEFLKGRVVIPFLGSIDQFKHVIRHELVHVFTMAKLSRMKKDFRLNNEPTLPLWFIEGLAEFWSTDWDSQAEMVLKDAVLNNYFTGLKNIEQIYGSYLMYKEGQKILQYIDKEYGSEKILALIENVWRSPDFEYVFETVIGKTIEDFDAELISNLKKEYYPKVKNENFISSRAKKLTNDGINTSPVIFIDSIGDKYIYFLANIDGYSSIYRINMKNSDYKKELIIRGEKSEQYENFHLLRTNIAINNQNKLAFITKKASCDVINIFNLTENNLETYYEFDEIININYLNWSNDGNSIVFSAIDKKGYSDLFLLDILSNRLFRLTNDYYDDNEPVFNKNNDWIIFSSDRTGGEKINHYNLFAFNLKTSSIYYITANDGNNRLPKFSPDFNSLFFINDAIQTENIWQIKNIKFFEDSIYFEKEIIKCTDLINTIFDFSFVEDSILVIQGFEKYSFNLYLTNIQKNDDFNYSSQKFNLEILSKSPWLAEKLQAVSEREKYRLNKEYTLDFAQSEIITNPIYGTSGGAIFSISDMLSDERYIFYIYNTAQVASDLLESFNVSISKISLEKRTNYGFGVFNFSGRRYDIRESDEYFYERSFGGYVTLHYPFSTFRRIEISTGLLSSNKEIYRFLVNRKSLLLLNTISYVYDNSLWYYTGPIDGMRYSILFGLTNDIKYSNVNFYSVMFDFRYYLRLGLKSTLAYRFQFFANSGQEARRYFMGGSWDLRGWDRWSIRGEKLWLTSIEARFPLIDELIVRFPVFDLKLYGLRAAIYSDIGSAWDDDYKETLGSIGFGFRINLFGVLVLRYDIGKKIENNFSKLQKGLFYQFFFGWDF